MQRRKFVIGAGALASGAAAAVGTGAFSVVRAERTINVGTTGDSSAYLGLDGSSKYASGTDDGKLELTFDELNEDSDTRFDDVFTITNTSDSPTRLSFHDTRGETGYDSPAATWYYNDSGEWAANEVNADNPELGTGETIHIHVLFNLTDYEEDALPEHLGIYAGEV